MVDHQEDNVDGGGLLRDGGDDDVDGDGMGKFCFRRSHQRRRTLVYLTGTTCLSVDVILRMDHQHRDFIRNENDGDDGGADDGDGDGMRKKLMEKVTSEVRPA